MSNESKCPFSGGVGSHALAGAQTNAAWWPNQLNLKMLHQQSSLSIPWARRSTTPRSSRAWI
jgi:catalase-peroxidase